MHICLELRSCRGRQRMFKSHLTKPGRLHVLRVIEIGSAGNCLDVVGVSGGYERESAVPSSSSVRDFSSGGGPSSSARRCSGSLRHLQPRFRDFMSTERLEALAVMTRTGPSYILRAERSAIPSPPTIRASTLPIFLSGSRGLQNTVVGPVFRPSIDRFSGWSCRATIPLISPYTWCKRDDNGRNAQLRREFLPALRESDIRRVQPLFHVGGQGRLR